MEFRFTGPQSYSTKSFKLSYLLSLLLTVLVPLAVSQTPAPTVSGISPQSGSTAGGTSVTVTGTNFNSGATVTFDNLAASNVSVVNSNTITATTPAHVAGNVNVTVTNPDGQSATLSAIVQLLNNPGFEAGTASWKFNGSGTVQVQNNPANAHSGNSYAELISGPSNHPVYYAADSSGNAQYFKVSPGDVITYGGWANRVSGTGKARWGLEITDSNKLNPVYSAASPFDTPTVGVWTQFQSTYTATANGFVRFYAEINGNSTVADVRFDDAVLQQTIAGGGFTYTGTPAPTVSGISPQSGSTAGGTSVTITGTNFNSGATVTFDNLAASNVSVVNSNTITATTPAHVAGNSNVTVSNPDGQSATLSGIVQLLNNPGFEAGAASWKFNGSGTVQVQNNPANAHSGNSYAEMISGPSNHPVYYAADSGGNAQYFKVSPGDVITYGGWANRVSGTGKARWGLEITDSNKLNPVYSAASPFDTPTVGVWTQFQSTYTATANGFVRFYAEINGNSTVADVRFDDAVLQQTLAGGGFTFASGPNILSLSPSGGSPSGGTIVTISGGNFQSGASVTFGEVSASNVTFVDSTRVTATAPAHAAGTVSVALTNPDGQTASLANAFTYSVAPSLTSITPSSGPSSGGTSVTLTGSGFQNGATVAFGTATSSSVTFNSSTSITAIAPPNTAGAVDVRVTNPDQQSSTLVQSFTYVNGPPAITSLSPSQGYASGGDTVSISGGGFLQGATVSFGQVPATGVTFVNGTLLRAVTPAHSGGLVDVSVTNPDGQNATLISLLHNEGFEDGSVFWRLGTNGGTATFINNAQNAHNGSSYVELSSTGTGSHPVLYAADANGNPLYFPVNEGDTVTFGGFAFGVSGNGSARWGLEATDATKKNPVYMSSPPYVAPDPIWARQQGTYTVPADKKFVRMYADLNGATVPAKARFDDAILKIVPGNTGGFQYLSAPIVNSVSPNWGSPTGGTTRTIYGTGFASGASVKFDGIAATNVQIVSANAILAFAPSHGVGPVDVSVVQGSQNASLPAAYTYRNPPLPPAGLTNLRHIIFTFQENRSFDNYFSQMNAYRQMKGVNDNAVDVADPNKALLDTAGVPVTPYHFRTVCHENTQPSWNASHTDYNGGKMDSFLKTTSWFDKPSTYDPTGTRAMGYYDWTDIPYYYELGFQFAISDRWFGSLLGPTNANRAYTFAATSLGWKSDPQPPSGGFPNLTIFDLLDQAGISWRYYYQQPTPAHIPIWSVYFRDGVNIVPISNYFNDIKNESTLPSVIFIEEARDEHPNPNPGGAAPPQSLQLGASVIKSFVDALIASPSWGSSAFILSYDEGGGLYDHVVPPSMVPPDGIPPKTQVESDQFGLFNIAGFRVPLTVVSPWVKPHFVSHVNRDHTAILKLIETRFGLPPLTARDDASDDMTEFFDFTAPAWQTPPPLPAQPTTGTCDLSVEKAPGR